MSLTLEDREAIYDLFARQNLAYDRREPEMTANMYTEDGVLEIDPGESRVGDPLVMKGRQSIEAYIRRLLDVTGGDYRHWTNSVAIEGGGTRAEAECYIAAWGMNDGAFRLAGRYFDKLQKVNGEWLFEHRRFEGEYINPEIGASTDDLRE